MFVAVSHLPVPIAKETRSNETSTNDSEGFDIASVSHYFLVHSGVDERIVKKKKRSRLQPAETARHFSYDASLVKLKKNICISKIRDFGKGATDHQGLKPVPSFVSNNSTS